MQRRVRVLHGGECWTIFINYLCNVCLYAIVSTETINPNDLGVYWVDLPCLWTGILSVFAHRSGLTDKSVRIVLQIAWRKSTLFVSITIGKKILIILL